jgi:toxin ParE1/3/4
MRISVHAEAKTELADGRNFYQTQAGRVLATDFIEEYDRMANLLGRYPEFGTSFGDGVRKQPMKRFPYNIMYRIRGEVLRILAIAHQSRSPFYWRGRV